LIAHGTANAVGEVVVVVVLVVLVVLVEFEFFSDVLDEMFELEAKEDRNDDVLLDGLGVFAAADTRLLDEIEIFVCVDELVEVDTGLELNNPLLEVKI